MPTWEEKAPTSLGCGGKLGNLVAASAHLVVRSTDLIQQSSTPERYPGIPVQRKEMLKQYRLIPTAEFASASQHLGELLRMATRLGEVGQQARAVPPETQEESLGPSPI
jgi:hypothetical protein